MLQYNPRIPSPTSSPLADSVESANFRPEIMHFLSLPQCTSVRADPKYVFGVSCSQTTPSVDYRNPKACVDHGWKTDKSICIPVQHIVGGKDRIREALNKVELSISSYDTAWVAMVPSPRTLKSPCFPKCIEWILENQHHDGSWGLPHGDPSLIKDSLSSTLACALALQRWNVGEEHVKRGLLYIRNNYKSVTDKKLPSPIGFDVIFPGMINYAIGLGLDLPMVQTDVDAIHSMRGSKLRRGYSEGSKAYHAYIVEGLSDLQDWQEVMKYQRKNGSLFNSPSATAAAVIHTRDEKALNYLHSLMQKFGNSVPTVHPFDICTHLCIVDDLERFGISRHFSSEIKSILDKIYRCWLDADEEITSDAATFAMAFRILRMNGYDVSSGALAQFDKVHHFNNSVHGYLRDVRTVLELYKASQIKVLADEQVLERIESWSGCYLKKESSGDIIQQLDVVSEEVDYSCEFPFYANLDRLEHKRNIERYKAKKFCLLKTSYINRGINNNDVINLAVEEFSLSQSVYRKELECLESWVKESKLDQLKFARQKLAYCYLSTAATIFPPEMSNARMSWAKNSVLTTVVDDFFDLGGSREELLNFIKLVEKWDGNHENESCSEQVEIVFSALYNTINELGVKASTLQNPSVKDHMIEIWLSLLKSMMKEAEWLWDKTVPTLQEYMENGYVSFALGPIIFPAIYFVGPKLSEDIIRNPEYHNLYKLVSTCGRLLNDVQGYQREKGEGKFNSLSLRILHGHGSISEDEAKREMEKMIGSTRRELLRLVLEQEGSVVPRACKDLFWSMSKVLHLFYAKTDGFSSPKEMLSAVNAVIHEPLKVGHLQL